MSAVKRISALDMNSLKITNLGTPTTNTDASTKLYVDTASTSDRSRANHTGTQLAATISDFNSAVQAIRLDQMAAPTASISLNSQKIVSLLDPTAAQDAATKNYVDTQIAGLVSGQVLKGSVRVVTTTNVTLSAPGASLDGVAMSAGEIFLATGQTTGTENGPYVWNGAAAAATRATNWDSSGEAVLGSYWIVREGTKADNFALLTNDTAITLGTTVPAFTFFAASGGSVGRYNADLPSITAGGTSVVTHNLGSKDITVAIYRVASPYDEVDMYVERTTTNTVTVSPDVAIASAEYRIVIKY